MMDMGGEIPPMEPSMGETPEGQMPMEDEMPTNFDSNFDAGVEADEETNPKRYIQQLTGKLSQSLNSYNNENGEPDTELGKYVLGMLVKQGVKGMDDKDKKEIIKKINSTSDDEVSMDDEMPEDEEMNTGEATDDMGEESPTPEMPMESKKFNFTKQQIFESFGISDEVEVKTEPKAEQKITPDTKRGRRTRPFEAPKKFKE